MTPTGQVVVASAGGSANRYPSGTPVTFERISGHRDGDTTGCPGVALYGQLPALRVAAQRVAPPPSATPPVPPATAAVVTAKAASRRIHAGNSVLLSGRSSEAGSVEIVVERAGGDMQFKFVRRVRIAVRNGQYRGRVLLRRPGLYRFTAKAGDTGRSQQVFVRAIRRTARSGGLAARS